MVVADKIAQVNNSLVKQDLSEEEAEKVLVNYVIYMYQNELLTLTKCAEILDKTNFEFVALLQSKGIIVPDDLIGLLYDLEALDKMDNASS